ncbi:hypothetical protein R3I94_018437 [Phoxinus phoxinus]
METAEKAARDIYPLLKNKRSVRGYGKSGQRRKKLEAKSIGEAMEEEKKRLDIEEEKYQAQIRKEAIEKAETQQHYQTDRVKGLHSALRLAEVLTEREAQIELKRMRQNASRAVDREISARMACREECKEGSRSNLHREAKTSSSKRSRRRKSTPIHLHTRNG